MRMNLKRQMSTFLFCILILMSTVPHLMTAAAVDDRENLQKREVSSNMASASEITSTGTKNVISDTVEVKGQNEQKPKVDTASTSDAEVSWETVVFTDAGVFLPPVQTASASLAARAGTLALDDTVNEYGLATNRIVEEENDGTGDYRVRLEVYGTRKMTSSAENFPVDIVLLLEQSETIAYSAQGSSLCADAAQKQEMVKQAAEELIMEVGEKYHAEDLDHRMAVVTFGSEASVLKSWTSVDEDGESALCDAIDLLPELPSGSADIAAGMRAVQELLDVEDNYCGENLFRQKVVIVVASSVPTKRKSLDTLAAADAIKSAGQIKDKGTAIYSVGIFDGANPDERYGNAAGNRFFNYLSTNTEAAEEIEEYMAQNRVCENRGYYLTADNADALTVIVKEISRNVSAADTLQENEITIKDMLSPYFAFADERGISVKTAEYQGGGNFGTEEIFDTEIINVLMEDRELRASVEGFDFNAYYVTESSREMDGKPIRGKKLIIEYMIRPREGFLGGNKVLTHTEKAEIFERKNGENYRIGSFEPWTVDVPIPDIAIKTLSPNVYLMGELTDEDYKNGVSVWCGGVCILGEDAKELEDWQKAYVHLPDISDIKVNPPSGYRLNDATYTLSCSVFPSESGTQDKAEGVSEPENIQVYKPCVTLQNGEVFYGESLPDRYVWFPNKDDEIVWKHEDMVKTEDTVMLGSEPQLILMCSPDFSAIIDGKVNRKSEIPVKITAAAVVPKNIQSREMQENTQNMEIWDSVQNLAAPEDLLNYIDFVYEDGNRRTNEMERYPDSHFLLHVKTGTLTIKTTSRIGRKDDDVFVFTIKKDGSAYTTCIVSENDEVTITELPLGVYEIEAETGNGTLAWRYGKPVYVNQKEELTKENTELVFSCTNKLENRKWLSSIFRLNGGRQGGGNNG